MIGTHKIVVVMPAYNAGKTLEKTFLEIPQTPWDEVILADDKSKDNTVEEARRLGMEHIVQHDDNLGYGGNQKSCYAKALELDCDIVIMVHPDYQYTPLLIAPMAHIIANGVYPVVFGSRILGKGALKGGMPWYKYVANRILTLVQNILLGQKLSEYHTGYRAFSREVLESIDFKANSNDFVFDNQMVAQIFLPDMRWRKSPVRPSTLKKPPPSISVEVRSMAWGSSKSVWNTECPNGGCCGQLI